jgi:hypothetical protein
MTLEQAKAILGGALKEDGSIEIDHDHKSGWEYLEWSPGCEDIEITIECNNIPVEFLEEMLIWIKHVSDLKP